MKQNESALVCLSGGQDSTTCLYWALKNFDHVEAVCFSYGQKHALEVEVARRIAGKAGVEFSLLDLSLLGQMTHNALTDASVVMDKEKPADALPNTFVPGRNMLFLTLAAIKAYEKGIRNLVTGVSQTRVPSVARKTPHPGLFPAFTRTRIVSDSPRLIPLTVCCFAERIPKDSGAATVNGPLRSGSE